MANLEKASILKLNNTAHLEPKYNTDIRFSTADYDSAILRFLILKNKKPMILGTPNVLGKIKLDHSDGSYWIDDLELVEKNKDYQFQYQLPNDLLSREGKVTAQVIIAEKGNSSLVVAQRIFTFDVAKSIYQNITAESKTQHIMEFSELKKEIRDEVSDIKQSIEESADYVTQIQNERQQALDLIQTLLTSSTEEIKALGDEKVAQIETTSETYLNELTTGSQDVNQAIQDFKDFMVDKDVVLQSETEDWQKFKVTNDDGSNLYTTLSSDQEIMDTLSPGTYYVTNAPHGVSGISTAGYLIVMEREGDIARKQIFSGYNNNRIITRWRFNAEWSDWSELVTKEVNEEIINQETLTQQMTDLQNQMRTYTDERHKTLFKGTVNGVDSRVNLSDDIKNYNMLYISVETPGGVFTAPVLVSTIKENIVIQTTNLRDTTGQLLGFYEAKLDTRTAKVLIIENDVSYDYASETGSGPGRNAFTILHVEGWK